LASHQPEDDREVRHLDTMLRMLDTRGEFRRDRFDPGHFTASAFVVSPGGSSLLLVYHTKLEKWLQPGGHIEPDDADLVCAARREAAEETGIDDMELVGLLDLDVHHFPARGGEPAHDHLDVRFAFCAGTMKTKAGNGTTKVRWFPLHEVAAWPDRPSLSRPAMKLLAPRS
jgi:8-oxo-dGTP pyrophosphatase MutT (NUDIX family)